MKKILLATSAILLSATLAQAKTTTVKVGSGNIEVGNLSESATMIGAEFVQSEKSKLALIFDLDGYFASDVSTTYVGIGGRYKLDNISLKATAGVSGVNFDTSNSGNTDLNGFVYGLGATYTFAKKHNIILDYKTGTVSDETGLVDVDVTYTSLSYGYSF